MVLVLWAISILYIFRILQLSGDTYLIYTLSGFICGYIFKSILSDLANMIADVLYLLKERGIISISFDEEENEIEENNENDK